MKISNLMLLLSICLSCAKKSPLNHLVKSPNDLHFDRLATVWDEAIPLGNGMIGVLIWEREGKLRFSLDRADLWDLRPMENKEKSEWKYSWVYNQWKIDDYKSVQDMFDIPYDNSPAPSKIPGASLEFDISTFGGVESVHLYVENAICEVKWKNGVRLLTFVHATKPLGWFQFEGLDSSLNYELIPPTYYHNEVNKDEGPVVGQDLKRLGYKGGDVAKQNNLIIYNQEGWGGFKYQVGVTNEINDDVSQGFWSISSEFPKWEKQPIAFEIINEYLNKDIATLLTTHQDWWLNFWDKSSIQVPDTILQKQWYLEQYKFGSAARAGAPPISLQAVWTADNGKLPPWKGDFHHDLNTQLSYWSSYSANHLDEEIGFIDWLWNNRAVFKEYTKEYFETEGLNVPGVSTLTGQPMGGLDSVCF